MSSNGRAYRPQIFKQSLALVLIPLTMGTVVLLALNQLWLSADKVALVERQQSDFVQYLNRMVNGWSGVNSGLIGATFQGGAVFEDRLRIAMPRLLREFAEAKMAHRDSAEQVQVIESLQTLMLRESRLLGGMYKVSQPMPLALNPNLRQLPVILTRVIDLRTQAHDLLDAQWDTLKSMRVKEDSFSHKMMTVVIAGVALNVFIAIFLAVRFSLHYSRRLKVLTEHARLLPSAQTMQPLGAMHAICRHDDEVAYVDRVMRETAARLAQAAQHRTSIISMVAHDMRSPLTAAQVYLDLVLDSAQDLQEASAEKLNDARAYLSGIITQVENLLSMQKAEPGPEAASALAPKAKTTGGIKIFHKVLLLVMTPLVVQSIFLLWIGNQLTTAQYIADRERRISDISLFANLVKVDVVKATAAQLLYVYDGNEAMKKLSTDTFEKVRAGLDALDKLAAGEKEWRSLIEEGKTMTERRLKQVGSLSPHDSPLLVMKTIMDIGEIENSSAQGQYLRDSINMLYKQDSAKLDEIESDRARKGLLLSSIFGWGIFANCALSIVLWFTISQSLSSRLNILVANAERLARGERLKKTVAGADEIAYLDKVLHQSQAQLEKTAQLRYEMTGLMAQEMRTPLRKAKEELKALMKASAGELVPKEQTQLSKALTNIDLVLALVDDLLTMESLESGNLDLEKSQCTATELAEEAVIAMSALANQKGVSLVNECSDTALIVDRARIVQVLINYLSNAIKFSPAEKTIVVKESSQADCVRISVIDEGGGIRKEDRERIFEKFFQGSNSEKQEGFGVGLAVCELIVKCHGGKLGVESEEGHGSTFWLEIPSV